MPNIRMVFMYCTPYHSFWLEIITYYCESKNLTTLSAQEKSFCQFATGVKNYIILWSFLSNLFVRIYATHQCNYATCACTCY